MRVKKEKFTYRTIKGMNVHYMGVNTETKETDFYSVDIPEVIKDSDKLLKAVKKAVETETEKVVYINDFSINEQRRKMSVSDFIKYSVPCDDEDETEEKEF